LLFAQGIRVARLNANVIRRRQLARKPRKSAICCCN
jgi:predicted alpha/beta-hydrolase family hydrolase